MNILPVLHTDRCILSAITNEEIPALRQIMDDQVTQHFLPELCEIVKTGAGLQQFLALFDVYLNDGTGYLWGIRKYCDELIGFIAIMDIPVAPILFFAAHPSHRQCGYIKEALKEVMQNIDSEHWFQSLQTEVYEDNVASLSLLHEIGFTIARRVKDKIYLINKNYINQ